jgi:hypothetical protein
MVKAFKLVRWWKYFLATWLTCAAAVQPAAAGALAVSHEFRHAPQTAARRAMISLKTAGSAAQVTAGQFQVLFGHTEASRTCAIRRLRPAMVA